MLNVDTVRADTVGVERTIHFNTEDEVERAIELIEGI